MAAPVEAVHFLHGIHHLPAQLRRELYLDPVPHFAEIQRALLDIAAKHFFQTHRLPAELQLIGQVFPRRAVLVLDRIGQEAALLTRKRDPVSRLSELHDIACPGGAQRRRRDRQIARHDHAGALFPQAGVVRPFVHKLPVHGPDILRPQIFDMDQSPLSAAEPEMLDPGKLEILVLVIRHL